MDSNQTPKHRLIYQTLRNAIASGEYAAGSRLPSESELGKTFCASRITLTRALRDLQTDGLIERRVGSGSYVRAVVPTGMTFGLLIPQLGQSEIFEPICSGMTTAVGVNHMLIWGRSLQDQDAIEDQAMELCNQLIAKRVSGVFFAPIEYSPTRREVNRRIVVSFTAAAIPVVLLDRDFVSYPQRSPLDLIGIDNRRAGHTITAHLLEQGCRRLLFLGLPDAADTVEARISGFREAIAWHGPLANGHVTRIDSADEPAVRKAIDQFHPDGIVCANDITAANLMHTLNAIGIEVPHAIRLVGIDDVKYANLLPVPLTTIRQPCMQMGAIAMRVMLLRLAEPQVPPRDILLNFSLVVRQSCGAQSRAAAARES
jgi:GntR family transcriptional regulator, arabinose operon transcriptional repressor